MLTEKADAEFFDAAGPHLKVVSNFAVGFNNIDVPACRARQVVATHTPDVLTNACAEFTWALILSVTRRLGEGEREVRAGRWKGWAFDHLLGMELRGKQLGLVGMGRIARAVADKAAAFGMSVAYTDQVVNDVPGATAMSLDRLLATSDVLSLHVNLTPATTHLIDQKALARMRRSAYLINTSRGPVVDEAALIRALQEGWIAGAGLDCFEEEPPSRDNPLLKMENVVLTPHSASQTAAGFEPRWHASVDSVIALANHRWPASCVNREVKPKQPLT